jgi:Flp pilus assembly protein TadG
LLQTLRGRCRRGLVTLEFALIAVPLIVAIMAILDFSFYLGTRAAFSNAVGTVTREALVNTDLRSSGAGSCSPEAETWVLGRSPLLSATRLQLCVAEVNTTTLQVTASYNIQFLFGFFAAPQPLTSTFTHPL